MARFREERIPWDSQPQEAAPLRPEIARYLSALITGASPLFDGCGAVTEAGGITRDAGQAGLAWIGDASNNVASAQPLVRDGSYTTTSTDSLWTWITVFRKRGTGVDANHIAGYGSTAGSGGNTLHRLIGGSTASELTLQIQSSSGGLPYNTQSSGANINDQRWHVSVTTHQITATVGDDALRYFVDGRACGTVARAAGVAATTFDRVGVGGTIRGGAALSFGNYEVALFVALRGICMPTEWCRETSQLSAVWDRVFEPQSIPVYVAGAGGASLNLAASALALTGAVAATGDLQYGVGLNLSASALAVSGAAAIAGDLAYLVPALDISASPLALTGTLAPSGDIHAGTAFDLAASALSMAGAASLSGDIQITTAVMLDLAASPLSIGGAFSLAGDVAFGSSFDLAAGEIAMAGTLSAAGDVASSDAPTTSGADGSGRRRRLYLGPDKKVRIEGELPKPAEQAAAAPMPTPAAVPTKPAARPESVADVLKRIAKPAAPIFKPAQTVAVGDAADQAAQAIEAAAIARQRQFEEDDEAVSAAMALLMA